MRQAGGVAARALQARSIQRGAVRLKQITDDPAMLRAFVEGLMAGSFEPDQYKTEKKNGGRLLESFEISCPGPKPEMQAALETARAVGEAVNWTRALVNEPGNVLTSRARWPTAPAPWPKSAAWSARSSTSRGCGSSASTPCSASPRARPSRRSWCC